MNIPIARRANSASNPLIITEFPEYNVDTLGNLLSRSHQIDPKAKSLLILPKNVEVYEVLADIFVLYYSQIKDRNTQKQSI